MNSLFEILTRTSRNLSGKVAVESQNDRVTYGELLQNATAISGYLRDSGTLPGDRVGLYARKSIASVASILGILKTGAAYVPVGIDSPAERNRFIFKDCSVQSILVEKEFLPLLQQNEFPVGNEKEINPDLFLLRPIEDQKKQSSPSLAYVLYTSGSTGYPKGVMYSHEGALRFIQWCFDTFPLSSEDRFSSHAPFHFDLSIFDLYVCFLAGGTLMLIDEETAKNPMELANFIAAKKISVWYSTPSVLSLMTQYGKLERYDASSLRLVLFAGEVFPVKYLSALVERWKHARFFNLYGPTETNVCTYFEIPNPIPSHQTKPFPIGKSCSHLNCNAFREDGSEITVGEQGELCVSGPIMSGYWNQSEKTSAAFLLDSSGIRWYKTGDIVELDNSGNFIYVSRRDRMVKRRGYRVELGEIESMLYRHPAVVEAAVIAISDSDGGIQIRAFMNLSDPSQASLIKMKQFASNNLPAYMIPDRFTFLAALPKTSTNKIDYQQLLNL